MSFDTEHYYAVQTFLEDAYNYWEDHFDDVVEEIREFADCKFKKDRKNDPTYLDYLDSERNLD